MIVRGALNSITAADGPGATGRFSSGAFVDKVRIQNLRRRSQRRTKFESLEKEQEGLEEALHPKPKEAPKFDVEKVNEENRRLASKPGQTPVYGD